MDNLIDQLKEANCDADSALQRFQYQKELYIRFVRGFLKDNSFESYEEAYDKADYKNAYLHIHTLKGLTANLGFTDLFNTSKSITEALKENNYSFVDQQNNLLRSQHNKITAIIEENEKM